MKKITVLFLIIVMLVQTVGVLSIEASSNGGLAFDKNDVYATERPLDGEPNTLEAWIFMPSSNTGRGGVIFGNYGFVPQAISFEIHDDGVPRLYYVNDAGTVCDYRFSVLSIPENKWTHLAIVRDEAADTIYCYINGGLKSVIKGVEPYGKKSWAGEFVLGGDLRAGNEQYFKGEIREIAIYSEVRTAEQINADIKAVDPNEDSLLAYYTADGNSVGKNISDKSKNRNDIVYSQLFITQKPKLKDYAYSFAVVGDTQMISYNWPSKLANIYDWIVDNADKRQIKYVFGLGDITDRDAVTEWGAARSAISKLNGVIPYSLVRGNHDSSAKFNEFFGIDEYKNQFGGFYQEGVIDNSWRTFDVGGHKYLFVTLDFGASDDILNWAGKIIEAHPDRKVIITTHCYLYRDGTTLDKGDVCPPNPSGDNSGMANNGDQMWDKLISKYENIILVISGHDPCEDIVVRQEDGVHGNTVTQILIDPQYTDMVFGPTGMVATLYFSEDGNDLQVEYYSTVLGKYYKASNQIEISLNVDHTEKPKTEETEAPPVTERPTETDAPDVTEKPDETDEPNETEKPQSTKAPDVIEVPSIDTDYTDVGEPSDSDSKTAFMFVIISLVFVIILGVGAFIKWRFY